MMKLITVFSILLLLSCTTLHSQLFVAYKATEGVSAAKKLSDASLTNSQLVGVVTLGDTSSALQLPINANFFDYTSGKSDGWIYLFRGKSKTTSSDTTLSIPIAKLPIIGFQTLAIDLPLSGIGNLFSKDSVLPNNFLESDKMIRNIQATADYKLYAKANPNPKASFVPVGYTPFCLYFPSNSPIWRLTFGGVGTNGTLNCEVHALTGEAKCTAIAVGVNEEISSQYLTLSPNPASKSISLSIPQEYYSPLLSLEVFNSIGVSMNNYSVSVGLNENITIPIDDLHNGVYFVKYSAGDIHTFKSFIVQH
ncbi:MAG: T9SS type A sorting domain-containing protein [Ignavibacteria bacterium]|nr:T9SS type A sorting domain-containing protein [Ignavibacteria bacterium]